jgi:hypothetical protein
LEQAIENYIAAHNATPKPFVWTASADLILGKIQKLCERINPSQDHVSADLTRLN